MSMPPFREGYEAAMSGRDDGGFTNPYPKNTAEHDEWMWGWQAAWEDEDRPNIPIRQA
jgi:ribosome modulation factor